MKTNAMMLLGCGVVIAAMSARGSLLPGTELKEWPTNEARHVISITREAADDAGKKMIEAAEAAAPGTNDWSCGVQNNIKQPFAITKDAIMYYEGVVKSYQKKTFKTYIEPRSQFEYKATVSHQDSFELDGKTYKDVYVVKMNLMFSADYTEQATLGVHVMKERTVVLDAKGTVQAIVGDEVTEMPMVAI